MTGAAHARDVVPPRVAVLDAGRSSLRAAVFDGTDELVRCRIEQGIPPLGTAGAQETVTARVDEALRALGQGPHDVLVLAATGIREFGRVEQELRAALSAHVGCAVILENDVVAAHRGAFDAGPGILVSAGTGSLVLGAHEDRSTVRIDGWGHLAGDRGSGFALGRAGLQAAFAAVDGTGPETALATVIAGEDPERTIRELYSSPAPVRQVAALARHVLDAAQAGDGSALDAVGTIAGELIAMILAAGSRLGDPQFESLRLARSGGLFESALFTGAVEEQLCAAAPGARWVEHPEDALRGGLLLALRQYAPPSSSQLIDAAPDARPTAAAHAPSMHHEVL